MDKNQLWRQIQKAEDLFQRRKMKRMILTILLYSVVHFVIICLQGQLHAENFLDIIGAIMACIFLGGITFYLNLLLWSQLWQKSQDEKDALEFLKKMLEEEERKEKRKQKELNK